MTQSRLLVLLLKPSLSSGTTVLGLTGLILGSSAWAYVSSQQLFYESFFGAYGLKTYLWQQSASLSAARDILLASPLAYYILVAVAAATAGLIVYALLQGLSLLFAWRTWSGLDALGPNRQAIAKVLARRLVLRILALAGWAIFGACFFSALLPFATLLNQTGIQHILDHLGIGSGILLCAAAVGILALCLHLQFVFLRLVFLRPRVFGGAELIEEAEAHRR